MIGFEFLLSLLFRAPALPPADRFTKAGTAVTKTAPKQSVPLVTDRPDFTESTETVPAGSLQLEGGYTLSRVGAARDHALGELLLRVPSGERAEIRVGLNSYAWSSGSGSSRGVEDATIGAKFRLAEGAEGVHPLRPAVSLIAMTTLPTGSSAYRSNDLQPTLKLALGWTLSSAWDLSGNLNYTYASDQGTRFDQISASLSFGHPVNDRVGLFFEAFGLFPGGAGGPDAHYLNTGVTYLVNPVFQLDLRVGKGLSGARPDDFIGLGAATRW